MARVTINPELLRWARERSGFAQEALAAKFKKLPEGAGRCTADPEAGAVVRERGACAGRLSFPARTSGGYGSDPRLSHLCGAPITRPSPILLDTIYTCQERQSWYRDFARLTRQPERAFFGSLTINTAPPLAAAGMRETLRFDLDARRTCRTWEEALRLFIRHAEEAGVLVMVSGIVGSKTARKLDPQEFRGSRGRSFGAARLRLRHEGRADVHARG